MLITFNKSGSLANIDFQYDSFSQGDNNVHIVDVIIDDESFNNLDYNGYVQFLREGETTPSPKLIMAHTEKGYTFKMNTEWYTAIAGTLKMTIEIKQYDENGLQSNKAFGVVNIPVMESVSGESDVETTITNEEYLALVNSLNEKAGLEVRNVFSNKNEFNNTTEFNSNITLANTQESDYVPGLKVNPIHSYDKETDTECKIEIPAKDGVVAFTSDIPELPTDPEFESVIVGDTNIESNNISMGENLAIGRHTDGTGGYVYVEDGSADNYSEITPTKISVENDEYATIINPDYFEAINKKDKIHYRYSASGIYYVNESNNFDTDILRVLNGRMSVGDADFKLSLYGKEERLEYNGKELATTEDIDEKVANLVNSAPETLNTLGELATALENHEDAYDSLLEVVGKKADATPNPEFESLNVSDIAEIDNLHIGEDIWINDEHGFSMGATQLTGGFLLIEGKDTYRTWVESTGVSTPNIEIYGGQSSLFKHTIPKGIGQSETKSVIEFEDGETYLFGDTSFNTVINSATKPRWYDNNGDYKELATMDDIQSGGSLPANPTFESVRIGSDETQYVDINTELVDMYSETYNVYMEALDGGFHISNNDGSGYTDYVRDYIDYNGNTLNFPEKSGTIATLEDINNGGSSGGSALDENGNLVFYDYNKGIVFDALTSSPSIYINEDNDCLEISPSTNFQSDVVISNKDNEFFRTYIDNQEISLVDDDNPAGVAISNAGEIYGYFISEDSSFLLSGEQGCTFRYGDSITTINQKGISTTEIELIDYDNPETSGWLKYNGSNEVIEMSSTEFYGYVDARKGLGVSSEAYFNCKVDFDDDVNFYGNVNFGDNLIASGSFTSSRILFDDNLIQANKTYMIIIKGPFQEVGWVSSTAIIRTSQFSGNYIYGETTLSWYEKGEHSEIFKLYLFSSDNGNGLDYDYVTSKATNGILSGNDYTYEIRLLPF